MDFDVRTMDLDAVVQHLLNKYGVRTVVNALADRLELEGKAGRYLPYAAGKSFPDFDNTVHPADLLTAASNLRDDLY